MMEATGTSETSVNFYLTTVHDTTSQKTVHTYHREILETYLDNKCYVINEELRWAYMLRSQIIMDLQ